jgi:hypothetical protein
VDWTAEQRLTFAQRGGREGGSPLHAVPDSSGVALSRLFRHACSEFRHKAPYRFPAGFRYSFDCGDVRRYVLDPNSGQTSEEPAAAPLEPPYLQVELDPRLFALLLIGALSWNIEDVTGRLRYRRVPNVYHPEVHASINHVRI